MIVRHDMDLESLGKMAQLPDDVSPLKIGSRGKYKNTAFDVIGRLKIAWSEGYWNEWFLFFEDGKYGWLAEAMGFFMLSFEVKEADNVPDLSKVEVGKGYNLVPLRAFFADDIKEAVCVGSEGELPFKGIQGRKTTSVDLSDHSGDFACIEYSSQDGVRLYVGRYAEFDELEFSNLRDLSADIKKIRSAKLFKCPSCGGPFSMRTPGHTASLACRYCGALLDTTNKTLEIIHKAEEKMKVKPLIPIGSKGKLFGTEWEVTGFVRRSDDTGAYLWDEYLLFNPYKGFRWLTTYKGHWNYVEMMRRQRVRNTNGTDVRLENRAFKLFLSGKAKIVYVLGEFYWRVKIDDAVDVYDYICPPEILSCETDKSEAVWSLGKYIEPKEVEAAFSVEEEMPQKSGVAPNQPSPYAETAPKVFRSFWVLAICLTLLQVYFVFSAPGKKVYNGNFQFDQAQPSKTIVTPSFDIPGSSGNLLVALHSSVNNDWVEAAVDLVDERTNQSLSFEQGVEYYSGTDSDGSWSEGNQNAELVLSSVPGGRYHLLVQPASDAAKRGAKSFSISLRRGVTIWSNYFVALFLLSIYPLYLWFRRRKFEQDRWSESDFSPYSAGTVDEGDDD